MAKTLPRCCERMQDVIEALPQDCSALAEDAACPCQSQVLSCTHALEQQASEVSSTADALEHKVHKLLAGLIAALMKGSHSMEACKRATDVFELLVAQHLSEPGPGQASLAKAAATGKGNSHAGDKSSSSSSSTSSMHAARVQVAVELGRSGLLQVLQQNLVWLRDYFLTACKHMSTILPEEATPASGETESDPPSSSQSKQQVSAQQQQQQLEQGLQALKAVLSPETQWQLDSCPVLYRWASMLINIWPSDVLTAPAAAGVVAAAAEAAACHFQCAQMAHILSETRTAEEKETLGLTMPPSEGVAAAMQLCMFFLQQLSGHIPHLQQQQQQWQQQQYYLEQDPYEANMQKAQQLLQQQPQQQQQPSGPALAPCVLDLFQERYRFLMPLCATALAQRGLQLRQQLLDLQQQQPQQREREGVGPAPTADAAATAVCAADESAAAAAAAAAAGQHVGTLGG